jgi:hypothetical protein
VRWWSVALLIAFGVAAGCSGTSQVGTREQSMHTIRHPNGLAVRFDNAAMTASQTERGFDFAPADAAERRAPWSAQLTLEPGARPSGGWPDSRDLSGRSAWWRVDTRPGGSAGSLFVLNAWTGCGEHHVALRLEVQAETQQDAEFDPGWVLLSSASCPPVGRRSRNSGDTDVECRPPGAIRASTTPTARDQPSSNEGLDGRSDS